MVLSSLLFGVMAWLTRRVTQTGLGGSQVAFIRMLGASVFVGAFALTGQLELRVARWDLLAARSLLGSLAALLYFVLLAHLPVGTTTLLHYSSPIFATCFASYFLGERPSSRTARALVAAFVGVVLVVVGQGRHLGGSWGWLTVGIASAAISGGAVVAVRAARRYDSAWTVFAAFSIVGAIFTAFPAFVGWREMTAYQWLLCLMVAAVSLAAQVLMTHALGSLQNALAGLISMLTVLFAIALGYLFDGERLSALSGVGAGLTMLGIVWAARVSAQTKADRP